MSEFEMSMGEELLDLLIEKLGSAEKVKMWIKDFQEWVDCCVDDGDDNYVYNKSNYDYDSDESDEDYITDEYGAVVEELTTETDERGFHSLKDCVVKSKK